jgi:NAD(P)-dependent dehydrogenase (short-subunit alcohol dehydrogenase family)
MKVPVTVLVTGATDGIGRETARALLTRGCRVLVHGRTEARARAIVRELEPVLEPAVPVWGDLSRMREVVHLAAQVREQIERLDVLVNNAGVYCKTRVVTEDGFELTMAVNHFAHVLLTHRLLPALGAAPAPRVVNVSSMTHEGAELDLDDLEFARCWSAYGAYAASKLANVLFTRAFAARHPTISANALHPGVIATKLLRQGFGGGGASVADGARTSVFLALAPEVAGVSGEYFIDCRARAPGRGARDTRAADDLWRVTRARLAAFLRE